MAQREYYWKGPKRSVQQFIRHCPQCQQLNLKIPNYSQLHLEVPQMPMDFISVDLIGTSETISWRNQNVLTVIFMPTNYALCTPLSDKSADTVVNTYVKEVYCWLLWSQKFLLDNGSEFKNFFFSELALQLDIKHIFSPSGKWKNWGIT